MSKINIAGLAESSSEIFEARPEGQYEGVISGVELTATGPDSKHPGSPMLKVSVKLVKTEEYPSQTINNYYVLPNDEYMDAEEMGRRTREQKRLCVATGITIADDGYDPEEMLDQPVIAVVIQEQGKDQYAGKVFNRIADLLPV